MALTINTLEKNLHTQNNTRKSDHEYISITTDIYMYNYTAAPPSTDENCFEVYQTSYMN